MRPITKYALPLAMMFVLALTRLPGVMPLNFSAVYGLAFCAGVYFPGKARWALPLSTLIITDLALNLFYYHVNPLNIYVISNYIAYVAIIWLGGKFSDRASWLALVGGGILGALIFYFVTNTTSWLHDPAYAKTLSGWIKALTIGSPGYPPTWEFFRNTLTSGGLFSGLFAGAMKLSEAAEKKPEEETEEEEEGAPEESKA